MEGNLEQELGQGENAAAFSWTTQDEIDFIDSLYEEGKVDGEWTALRRYPMTVFLRRWDSTVNPEAVAAHARKRKADVEFYLAMTKGN